MKPDIREKRTVTLNIDLNGALIGFGSARTLTPAHHKIMKYYASPLLFGPPPSDDLLELIMHMFTEDEADLVQHLPPFLPRSAEKVARLSGRSVRNVKQILDRLAFTKLVILAGGSPRSYTIVPIVPGAFEMALMKPEISGLNAWHKEFAELFERLWDEGFMMDYVSSTRPPVRYLPVGGVSNTLNMAWPSDKLEDILEPYDLFAVGNCQCRLAMQLVGRGCDRPTENCVAIGPPAIPLLERSMMRKADRQEIIEIKRNAENHGCVTWMINEIGDRRGNGSCSCCGCCCHALRSISQFSTPGMISKPHFMPVLDSGKCTSCTKCADACPMGARTMSDGKMQFNSIRCIGCGLCVLSCTSGALSLKPVDNARPPEKSWLALFLKMMPGYVMNTFRVWAKRRLA